MTDYEKWLQRMILDAELKEECERANKLNAIDEAMAHINKKSISSMNIKNTHRMAQANIKRNFYG